MEAIVALSHEGPTPSAPRRHHAVHATSLPVTLDEDSGPAGVLVHRIASSPVTFKHVVPLLRSEAAQDLA